MRRLVAHGLAACLFCVSLAVAVLAAPPAPTGSAPASEPPSPSAGGAAAAPACPVDMRLVDHPHAEAMDHTCTDQRGKYCFAFAPNVSRPRGEVRQIRTCMDVYEAPNVRGALPIVMKSGIDAEAYCAARGKRLCSEHEWETACEGPELRPWVYGWTADGKTCNSGKSWRPFDAVALYAGGAAMEKEMERLWQGEASGTRAACVSQDGVYDLVGNVEEWVTARKGRTFRLALMGGFWAKPWTGCRGTNDAHEPAFRFYEVGFRCCKDPT